MATKKKAATKSPEPVGKAPSITTRAQAEAHVRGLTMQCRGPRIPERTAHWQKLMDAGKMEEARAVETRAGCGYNFADTVVAHPFDGAEHLTKCPKCGIETSWKSPVFDGLNETRKAKR